jgi:hypothetical protein
VLLVALACAASMSGTASVRRRPPSPGLTGADGLVKVYDAILDADFDAVDDTLQRACPPAPRPACDVLAATRTWWRIQIDPQSTALDETFSSEVERAIASTEAWAAREPANPEAHFYVGGAYAARVQWRVLRNERLAAARDGKRIKSALERAVALDPSLEDAYFGIGLYEYYADVAPAAARFLRFLLLLPGGDRAEGLQRMQRTHANGRLLQGEADYQLAVVYLWYENRSDLTAALLEGLRTRYPGNPIFTAQLADLRERYDHDLVASLATWRALLEAAGQGRVNEAEAAAAQARLAVSRLLDALDETDIALDELRSLIDSQPARPLGARAAGYLALGEAEDRLGHRDAAVAAYRLAASAAPSPDPGGIGARATDRLRHAPDAVRAEAYRLSLEGWRRVQRGDATGGEPILAHAVTLDPNDAVARYRHARALQARRDDEGALVEYGVALQRASALPAPLAAAAFFDTARLEEQLGRRDQAVVHYRAAMSWFGGGTATRDAATRALARLTPTSR